MFGTLQCAAGLNREIAYAEGLIMSEYKDYLCVVCGFVYSEAAGLPEEGFSPGTRWEDIPENWVCPECGAAKEDFEMVEV